MTTVLKSYKNKHFYICMEMEHKYNRDYYLITVNPVYNDNLCGYPIRSMVYSLDERKNALATFNRYKRTYQ